LLLQQGAPRERAAAAEAAGNFAGGFDRHCRDLPKEVVQANLAAGMPSVIRQKMPLSGTTTFQDAVYGDISVENSELEDQVLLKPMATRPTTSPMSSTITTWQSPMSCAARNTSPRPPNTNLLYDAFGWEIPTYVHCP
jgi:glutamyl-tRNA synthetase